PTHRYLHSFPTRRSSDLFREFNERPPAQDLFHQTIVAHHIACLFLSLFKLRLDSDNQPNSFSQFSKSYDFVSSYIYSTAIRSVEDRKSTRLNSSHDQISY